MAYKWDEYTENYNGNQNQAFSIRIDYNDGTPCYEYLKGKIKFRDGEWHGEIGGTNQMAEYLSNGWDRFEWCDDEDFDVVYDAMNDYIDYLVEKGNIPQEWVDENYID